MSARVYTQKTKLWEYPGPTSWYFLTVPKKTSEEIKKRGEGKPRRGWGSVPVSVTIGKTTWQTSIFPDKTSGAYLLPVKASVRKTEDITEGSLVTYSLRIRA